MGGFHSFLCVSNRDKLDIHSVNQPMRRNKPVILLVRKCTDFVKGRFFQFYKHNESAIISRIIYDKAFQGEIVSLKYSCFCNINQMTNHVL